MNREPIEHELGDREFPDVTEIIHQMRDERDIQILSTIYGEAKAREMVLGPDVETDETE